MGPHSSPGPCGAMTLAEAVDGIFSRQKSEAKERERRNIEQDKIKKKHKEYYEAHMREETERLTLISMGGGGGHYGSLNSFSSIISRTT